MEVMEHLHYANYGNMATAIPFNTQVESVCCMFLCRFNYSSQFWFSITVSVANEGTSPATRNFSRLSLWSFLRWRCQAL